MQKNIVFGVNAALAAESSPRENQPVDGPLSGKTNKDFEELREEIANLKRENDEVAVKMAEMKAESESLKQKIEEILSKPTKTKSKKKKK